MDLGDTEMDVDFFFSVLVWGETESTWYVAPDDRLLVWVWSSEWNDNWQGKPNYSEKICLSSTLSTLPDLGSNPGSRRLYAWAMARPMDVDDMDRDAETPLNLVSLARDINLPKNQTKLLGSRLKVRNLLGRTQNFLFFVTLMRTGKFMFFEWWYILLQQCSCRLH
jgi:hypothetical protein